MKESIRELRSEFEKLKAKIEKLESIQAKSNVNHRGKWPEHGDDIVIIQGDGLVYNSIWSELGKHEEYLKQGRVTKTMEESKWRINYFEQQAPKLNLLYELEQLANEVNEGVEIDWKDKSQLKYCLYFNGDRNTTELDPWYEIQYSSYPVFLKNVTKEINEKFGDILNLLWES